MATVFDLSGPGETERDRLYHQRWEQRRTTVLAAKAVIITGLVLAAGAIAVLLSLLAGRLSLSSHGFTPAHGYQQLSLTDSPVLRAAAGSTLQLALIALLSLGAASAVRDSAAAIGTVLGLLYLFPIIAAVVTNPTGNGT